MVQTPLAASSEGLVQAGSRAAILVARRQPQHDGGDVGVVGEGAHDAARHLHHGEGLRVGKTLRAVSSAGASTLPVKLGSTPPACAAAAQLLHPALRLGAGDQTAAWQDLRAPPCTDERL